MGSITGIVEMMNEQEVVDSMGFFKWPYEASIALFEYIYDYSDDVGEAIEFDSLELAKEIDYATESDIEDGGYGYEGTIEDEYLIKFEMDGENAYLFPRKVNRKWGEKP